MEESRQASVELVDTADHTGCGVQHSLQFVGHCYRRTRQYCVAVVNAIVGFNVPIDTLWVISETIYASNDPTNSVIALKDDGQDTAVSSQANRCYES